jgi:hypothetical protein
MNRSFLYAVVPAMLLLLSCGSGPKTPAPKAAPPMAEVVKPLNQSHRFPKANLVKTEVVDRELMGKSFMPGGTLAHYRKGKAEYQMFVARFPSATDAAIVLPDWRKALAGSKLVPSFGGYFGSDGGRPVFVFSKGAWVAGIAGLPEKEADLQARALAGELD